MRLAVLVTTVTLGACAAPEQALDLPVTGEGLAVTADAIYVEREGALYEAPRDGGAPRALAAASPERGACERDAVIEVSGDEVFWLERDGYLHRVHRVTGAEDVVYTACPHDLEVADGVAYWNRGTLPGSELWRWGAGEAPALAFDGAPTGPIVIDRAWLYGFEGDRLVRRTLDGRERLVLSASPYVDPTRGVAVADGHVYYFDARDGEAVVLRVWSGGGGPAELLGRMSWSRGRTLVDDGVVFSGAERLVPGDDEAERWLPSGGPSGTVIDNLAIDGDDLFWLSRDRDGPARVLRYDKHGDALSASAGEPDLVTPPFL